MVNFDDFDQTKTIHKQFYSFVSTGALIQIKPQSIMKTAEVMTGPCRL